MKRRPGAAVAARGCVPCRPWSSDIMETEIERLVDFIAKTTAVSALLGPNFDVSLGISKSGRGLIFQFEPIIKGQGVSGS